MDNMIDIGTSSRTAFTADVQFDCDVTTTKTSILNLPWDVYVTNVLLQPCMTFQDCYNALLVTHGASSTVEEFETMLGEQEMDGFWAKKFRFYYPKLYFFLLSIKDRFPNREPICWFSRTKFRWETASEIPRILEKFRREKLRCRLEQEEKRQNSFLCQILVSDPADIRFPYERDRRGIDESHEGCMPKCSVSILGKQPPLELSVYGLEFGHQSNAFPSVELATDLMVLRDKGQFFAAFPSNFDLNDVDAESPPETLKTIYVLDELKTIVESKDSSIQYLRQSAKELMFVASNTLLNYRVRNFSECVLLKTSSTYNVEAPSETRPPQRREINQKIERETDQNTRRENLDLWILPVGSLVSYRTQALIGYGVTPLLLYGTVIGWTRTGKSVTYKILPITKPTITDVEANPDFYYRTRDLVAAITEITWITEISDENGLRIAFFSDEFLENCDPFFDRFDGIFLIPTADFAQLYPDDEVARNRLQLSIKI